LFEERLQRSEEQTGCACSDLFFHAAGGSMTDQESFTISGLGYGNTIITAACNICNKKIELSGLKLPMIVDSMESSIRFIFAESGWSLDAELHPFCPEHREQSSKFKKCTVIGKQGRGLTNLDGEQ